MGELVTSSAYAVNTKSSEKSAGLLQLVTFALGYEEYGVDILKVHEINRMREITKVPNAASDMEGVINLRGKVIPIVNLRRKFGLAHKENDDSSRIMIMDVHGATMGLIVDAVSEVLRIPSNIVEPPPPMATDMTTEFIMGIAKLEDRLIILLELDRLFARSGSEALLEA